MKESHIRRNEETFSLVAGEQEYFRWQSQKVDLIASILRERKPAGLLADVGCFTGIATAAYHATGFDRTIGFDSSVEALNLAAARGIETRVWRIGEEPCPAAESEFNTIVAADVIEHIVDTDAFLSELWRVLRDDGLLIVTTPNLAFWMSRLRLLSGKPPWSYPGASSTVKADLMIDLNHIRVTTRAEWECLFRARSFDVLDFRGWSMLHAQGDSIGIRIRRIIDRCLAGFPELAFGLLFVLKKVPAGTKNRFTSNER
jgi:2-polyprenyl-3-methyl-5-hydroxy-6-metoxy-1,4-benzoquinol methylase